MVSVYSTITAVVLQQTPLIRDLSDVMLLYCGIRCDDNYVAIVGHGPKNKNGTYASTTTYATSIARDDNPAIILCAFDINIRPGYRVFELSMDLHLISMTEANQHTHGANELISFSVQSPLGEWLNEQAQQFAVKMSFGEGLNENTQQWWRVCHSIGLFKQWVHFIDYNMPILHWEVFVNSQWHFVEDEYEEHDRYMTIQYNGYHQDATFGWSGLCALLDKTWKRFRLNRNAMALDVICNDDDTVVMHLPVRK